MPSDTVTHLESLRADLRDELKKRIEQRDKYSVQLTISLSAIVAVAFSRPDLVRVLIAAPLASLYFTALILYSYKIHSVIATYLREVIEPKLAEAQGVPVEVEWENYYSKQRLPPGVRKTFFVYALWTVTILTAVLLLITQRADCAFVAITCIATAVYLAVCAMVQRWAS